MMLSPSLTCRRHAATWPGLIMVAPGCRVLVHAASNQESLDSRQLRCRQTHAFVIAKSHRDMNSLHCRSSHFAASDVLITEKFGTSMAFNLAKTLAWLRCF